MIQNWASPDSRAQLCHRRNGVEPRQIASVRTRSPENHDSPNPALQNSLIYKYQTLSDVEYSDLLRMEFSNCNIFKYPDYPKNDETNRSPQSISSHRLLAKMAPVFRILKTFAFYGPCVGEAKKENGKPRCYKKNFFYILLTLYTLVSILFNLGLFGFNIYVIELIKAEFGMMSVRTMANIISGMKPLHNALNLILFLSRAKYHNLLWRQLSDVDEIFRRHLGVKLDIRKPKIIFFLLIIISFLAPLTMRVSEYFLLETFGVDLVSDLSLIFVPLLSVWQLLPLFYYALITYYIQRYFVELRKRMQQDPDLTEHSLEFYYRVYFKLTKSVSTLGIFFNPVAFFAISTSVVVLCLTIYFLTNASEIISSGPNKTEEEQVGDFYYVGWSFLHIFVATAYVLTLCVTGWRTNERARSIMAAALNTRPTDEHSRFRVSCFLHRNQTQWNWGITVWRAFPVERSFLFTLVSAISTYAVLLLKLQQKPCVCNYAASNETVI